jgi:hypothetical protein
MTVFYSPARRCLFISERTKQRRYELGVSKAGAIGRSRAAGWSYREIGREVGLHWTRVRQILRQANGQ